MEQNDWSERNVNGKQTFPKSRKRKRKQEEKKQKKFKSEKDKKDCGNNNCNVVPSSSDKSGHSKNIDSLTASKRYVEEESRYTKKTDIKKLYHDSNRRETKKSQEGDYCSMVRIRSLTSGSDSRLNTRNNFDFMLGPRAVWTCAWNGYTKQFSVGSEKQSLLIDVRTRKLWELKTGDSDALSQVFSGQGKPCLYSGTRKGQILTHDLRSNSVRPVDCLRMTSSISCLRLLQDDVRLLASDVKGKINLWDIRMKKELVEYKGCKNEYSRIPVHIDETERLVYGVGQDGYVNFWCLNSGKLLRSLPPPVTTDIDTIPAVKYSERWGNKQGNSGLVMGLGDKLFLYPSFTSESQTV